MKLFVLNALVVLVVACGGTAATKDTEASDKPAIDTKSSSKEDDARNLVSEKPQQELEHPLTASLRPLVKEVCACPNLPCTETASEKILTIIKESMIKILADGPPPSVVMDEIKTLMEWDLECRTILTKKVYPPNSSIHNKTSPQGKTLTMSRHVHHR